MYIIKNLEIKRGDFLLKVEDLHIKEGQIYTVIGPNGCGKSTFLEMLAFLCKPQKGELFFKENMVIYNNLINLKVMRRQIGYLMQAPYLFNLTVFDNLSLGLKIRRFSSKIIKEKVYAILDKLRIKHLSKRNAHSLSGGEKQRVALARTFVLDADVFLLDEPITNVDKNNIAIVEDFIRLNNQKYKKTIVLTTHCQNQTNRFKDNLISLG